MTPEPVFSGFTAPTSNTTYTPNQFFDVCLPHRSRGCVRIVALMLRKTLGWSDAHGHPLHEQFTFTYDDLTHEAGVSRDMLKSAIDEAIRFGFVNCIRKPSPKVAGGRAISGLYELRWDEQGEYVKDPQRFRGFFAGEGNRTYIPNQFFDVVVRQETLAVIKVVGSIARFSIGFANKFGHRRTQAAMSFLDLRRYARMSDRTTLATAIRYAVEHHYIQIVQAGFFDRAGGRTSTAAIYALRWLNHNLDASNGRKSRPGEAGLDRRSENQTGNGRKTRPAEQSENQTDIQITSLTNNNLKQQQPKVRLGWSTTSTLADADAMDFCCSTLKKAGFDTRTAEHFAKAFPIERVLNQIEWLPMRGVARNRLGMLRRAIEQNWPKPVTVSARSSRVSSPVDRTGEHRSGVQSGQPDWVGSPGAFEQSRQRLIYQLTLRPR